TRYGTSARPPKIVRHTCTTPLERLGSNGSGGTHGKLREIRCGVHFGSVRIEPAWSGHGGRARHPDQPGRNAAQPGAARRLTYPSATKKVPSGNHAMNVGR